MKKRPEREEARAMHMAGMSYNEIAATIGVSKSTVSLWCRDLVEEKRAAKRKVVEEICRVRAAKRVERESKKVGTPANAPFEDYLLYSYVNEKNGMRMIQLVHRETRNRIGMTNARYQMSCHLRRVLGPDENVRHVGDDHDDSIDNLVIMSRSDAARHQIRKKHPKVVKECVVCETTFSPKRKTTETCSRECRYKLVGMVLMDRARGG